MTRRLTLVLDLDNTTLRYNPALARFIHERTGRIVPDTCPSYDFTVSQWFNSRQEFLDTHRAAVLDGMFATMDAYNGAAATIAALRANGVYVKVATFRAVPGHDDLVRKTTLEGLDRNGIEYDELHFVQHKYEIDGDVYLDDAPYVIEALDERDLNRVVFDQEYNRQFDGPRIATWADLPDMLEHVSAPAPALA